MKTQLKKTHSILKVKNIGECIGCYACMMACATTIHKDFSLGKSAITVKTSGGYQGRLVVDICRGCREPACVNSCSFNALKPREGGGIKYTSENCNGCKSCIKSCLVGAIKYNEDEKKVITCYQCGICANRCPHHVLAMEVR